MALGKAMRFVKDATRDSEFRKSCISFDSKDDLFTHFKFDALEFDDAINMELVKCKTYEQAETYQQLRLWFSML